jgi:hypothetical protein
LDLTDEEGLRRPPEKRLADLDAATLAHSFAINAVGPALLIKHLHDLLPLKERSFLAVLDALPREGASGRFLAWNGSAVPW